jgi:hypothetical protein
VVCLKIGNSVSSGCLIWGQRSLGGRSDSRQQFAVR